MNKSLNFCHLKITIKSFNIDVFVFMDLVCISTETIHEDSNTQNHTEHEVQEISETDWKQILHTAVCFSPSGADLRFLVGGVPNPTGRGVDHLSVRFSKNPMKLKEHLIRGGDGSRGLTEFRNCSYTNDMFDKIPHEERNFFSALFLFKLR